MRGLRPLPASGARWLGALAVREPPLVACRRPPTQPRTQQSRGLARLPATKESNDQRVLDDLALRVAPPDPRQIVKRCFQQTCRLRAIAAAEPRQAGAEISGGFSRRQTAVTSQALQPGDAAPDAVFIADRGFGQCGMEIGKGKAGAREMLARMGRDLGPFSRDRR